MREIRFTFSSVEIPESKVTDNFFSNVTTFLTNPMGLNTTALTTNSEEIDLSTSIAHLHTNRTIGHANPSFVSRSSFVFIFLLWNLIVILYSFSVQPSVPYFDQYMPNNPTSPTSPTSPNKPSSGVKVAERVYDHISKYVNLQVPFRPSFRQYVLFECSLKN